MVSNEQIIQEPNSGSLRDFLMILFKRKADILTIFLAVVITVTVGSFLISPTYEAKSSLLVKFGREFFYLPEVGEKATMTMTPPSEEEAVNSEISILTSRDIIEQVIKTIKLENIYPDLVKTSRRPPMETAVIAFQKTLTAEGVKKSSVIEVSFRHKNPKVAARAVNLLVDFFKEKHLQVYSGTGSNFLESQTNLYGQELKNSENRVEAYKQKNRISSLDEQRSLLLRQRTELDTTLKNTRNQIDELGKKLVFLRGHMKKILADNNHYTQTERDKIIVDARIKLLNLQLSEQDLSSKYPDNNRFLVNTRKEIEVTKDFLREQEAAIAGKVKTGNPVYQEAEKEAIKAESEGASLQTKAVTLQAQIGQLDNEIRTLDLQEKELKDLNREVSTNEMNYKIYQEKKEDARISEEMNRQKLVNISVIQAAVVPSKPVRPKKALNILLSIILGAFSGLGYAFLSEYKGQRLSTPEVAEKKLGLPVLATVSLQETI